MLDTVFGAIEAGVLSERADFERGSGNRNYGRYEYSATLSKYKETHERVLLIFPVSYTHLTLPTKRIV